MRDLANHIDVVIGTAAAVLDADATGATVNRSGYESVTFQITTGNGGITFDATNKIEFVMQHSDDGSTWSAVESKDVITAETDTITSGIVLTFDEARTADVYLVGYVGEKQYARLNSDFSGTHGTGTLIGINAILGHPHIAPKIV